MPITITVRNNGPYLITVEDAADTVIVDAAGTVLTSPKGPGKSIALCRCGASAIKPFCDGTHNRIGFQGASPPAPILDEQLT